MPIVNNIDLGKILTQAAQLNRYKLDAEERRQKMEMDRRQQELINKVVSAQRRVFQAKTPEARESAEAELGSLDAARLAKIRSDRRAEEDQVLGAARKRRELSIDQNLAGARLMKDVLPGVIQQTPAGPQVSLPALFQATGRMTQMAQQGIVAPEQAHRLQDMFRKARELTIQGGQGAIGSDEMMSGMQGIASGVQELLASADQGIEMFGDPEKRKRFQSNVEDQARMASNIAAEQGETDVTKYLDPDVASGNPELWAAAGKRLASERNRRASLVGGAARPRDVVPTTRGAATHIQKNWLQSTRLLKQYQDADVKAEPWMFTIPGQALVSVGRAIERWTPANVPEALKGRMDPYFEVANNLERSFSMYRKLITGAQAALAEIQYLRKQAPNMDMSWTEFQDAMKIATRELQDEIKLYNKALRIGFETFGPEGPTKEWMNSQLGEMRTDQEGRSFMFGGALRGTDITDTDVQWRIEQLEQGGYNPKQAAKVLLHEGYFTEEQARIFAGE